MAHDSGATRLSLRKARWATAGVVALAAACARQPPSQAPQGSLPPVRIPLAAFAVAARPVVETRALDFGEPAARAAMWSGWGPDEKNPEMTFAWGGGVESRLALDIVEPRDLDLRMRGWSYPFADGASQEVRFVLNGDEVGRRELARQPGPVSIRIPARFVRAGENQLELCYRRWEDRANEPPWAAAWDRIEIDGRENPPAPRLDAAAGTAELPAGTAFEWALDLPGGSWLAWDAASISGSARLDVSVTEERSGAGEQRSGAGKERSGGVERRETFDGAGRMRLTDDAAGSHVVGFAVRAVGSRGGVRIAALRIHEPSPVGGPASSSAASSASPSPSPAATPASRPNLIVYLIDTLRADHLGCYGYPRPTSPEIDRFAREGVLVREARAQASWTRPAVATILTGLYPITHGSQQKYERIPEAVETLSERLFAQGYETALFTTNANVAGRFGFNQGWSSFNELFHRQGRHSRQHLKSSEMNPPVFDWLAHRDAAKPFFLFVHTVDPHDPYLPDEEFRRKLAPDVDVASACCRHYEDLMALPPAEARRASAAAVALYDAEIAQNDASFGALLAELDRRGLTGTTAVLLIADHGEEFYDHGGWKHGWTLYEEMLRVPFVLRLPGRAHAGLVVAGPVDQVDVAPTLLELAGAPAPKDLPGRSLLPAIRGETRDSRGSLAWLVRPNLELRSIARDRWKLIRNEGAWMPPLGRSPYELYELASDPGERSDVAAERWLRRRWLDGQLAEALARFRSILPAQRTTVDPELEKALRALGYI